MQILADAYGHTLYRRETTKSRAAAIVRDEDVIDVVQAGRITRHTAARPRKKKEIGRVHGLGVSHYIGSIIEIEAAAFPAREARKGTVRFNDTAGSMSRDSVFNAASVVRALCGIDPSDYDLHVNVIGGGNIDGPSAGLAFFLALYSAITRQPLPQDMAVTGEVSLAGNVRGVGGIVEKLYAARAASMRAFLLPLENAKEIEAAPDGIEIVPVRSIADVLVAYGLELPVPPVHRSRRVVR